MLFFSCVSAILVPTGGFELQQFFFEQNGGALVLRLSTQGKCDLVGIQKSSGGRSYFTN